MLCDIRCFKTRFLKNFFRFLSVCGFLIVHPNVLSGSSLYTFDFFLFESACQDVGHDVVHFFYLCLFLLTGTSIEKLPFRGSFLMPWSCQFFSTKKNQEFRKKDNVMPCILTRSFKQKRIKYSEWRFTKNFMMSNELYLTLNWWISHSNVMIHGWNFRHNLFTRVPTYPENFTRFACTWPEIVFRVGKGEGEALNYTII
jgi:hypothetical protein